MLSIALCDDEDLYLEKYEKLIKTFFSNGLVNFEIIKFKNSESLLFYLEDNPYRFQLIILDLIMPKINGIQVAYSIKKLNPYANIVFLSISKDFIFEALDVLPINYLIKDKDDYKLLKIIEDMIAKKDYLINKDNFTYQSKSNIICIPNASIMYFEVFHRIITIHKINEPKYDFYCSLKYLEKHIDSKRFIKIFRSFIVNMQYIRRINPKEIELMNGMRLPISRELYHDIKDKYSNYLNT